MNRRRYPALLVLFGAIAGLASAQTEYQAHIIEPWDQNYALATSRASGINNHNVVTGCASPISGNCSFLWTLDGGKEQVNLGGVINDDGIVAGLDYYRTPEGQLFHMSGLGAVRDLNNSLVAAGAVTGRYWGGCRYTRSATVWDATNGSRSLETDFGLLSAHEARAINNANEVVGVLSSTGSCGDFEAFYLNLDTGEHVDIHTALVGGGMAITEAFDINDAGTIVGTGPVDNEVRAFTWNRAGGFVLLPNLPGTLPSYSSPSAINNHGTVVGQAITGDEWRAWIWDETNGVRDLNDLSAGLPADFVIHDAVQINDNGWIIASGFYGAWSPERAVVLVPVSDCPADFNDDGDVNTLDVLAFLNAWNAEESHADFNQDGDINTLDVLDFLNAWNTGC
ncbi:MAG: GC-type dockerin domain-anchored protein [Phycisphaerales bacterium JB041]